MLPATKNGVVQLALLTICALGVFTQEPVTIPKTKFSCQGRVTGYYADLETGCQVYHMCDGLGRQFSYSCPNTTLFQQRMLICDHWYMVNCTNSEKDYSANLLIGQRDKPFVSDDEDHQRTPRPDILSVPYALNFNNYRASRVQFPSIGSSKPVINDHIANGNNDLSEGSSQFVLPTRWSTELSNKNQYTTQRPFTQNSGFGGRPIIVSNAVPSGPSGPSAPGNDQSNSQGFKNFGPSTNQQFAESLRTASTEYPQKSGINQINRNDAVNSINPRPQNTGSNQFIQNRNFAQHKTVNNIFPQNNGFQLKNNNANQNLESRSSNVVINPPPKLIQPPKKDFSFAGSSGQQLNSFKKPSSTTVRSIATFNNQFIGSNPLPPSLEPSSNEDNQPLQFNLGLNRVDKNEFTFIKRFNPDEADTTGPDNNVPTSFSSKSDENQQILAIPNNGFEIQSSSETAGIVSQPGNGNQIPFSPSKSSQDNSNKQTIYKQTNLSQDKVFNVPVPFPQGFSDNNNFESPSNSIVPPTNELLPPKTEYSEIPSTTMGPPIYYEWKWAPPAFDLEPPKPSVFSKDTQQNTIKEGRPDYALPRSTTLKPSTNIVQITERSLPQVTSSGEDRYKQASYFIPDYVFPLDKEHPGYTEDGAMTSFQVRIPHSASLDDGVHPYYGENAQCPHCHPSFVVPGTCTPCVMIRR